MSALKKCIVWNGGPVISKYFFQYAPDNLVLQFIYHGCVVNYSIIRFNMIGFVMNGCNNVV